MTDFIVDKNKITKKIIELINPEYTNNEFEFAKKTWWNNIRSTGGLGLTFEGKEAFDLAEIDFWDFQVKTSEIIKSTTKLKLDHYFPSPYYLFLRNISIKATPIIRVYDSRIASLIMIHGSLTEYLISLHVKISEIYLKKQQ